MTKEEAIERFNGIINAMSISIAQSKFYPSKAELDELCDMAIEALSADAVSREECNCVFSKPKIKLPKKAVEFNFSNIEVVVRCKDCKWHKLTDNSETEVCTNKQWDTSMWVYPIISADDFCSHGERRE